MIRIVIALLAGSIFALPAAAQPLEPDSDRYDGKWNVRVDTAGKPRSARLELHNFAGTWHDTGGMLRARAKDCKGSKFQVTVQASFAARLEFTIWGSSVSTACPDIAAELVPVSDTVTEGTLETGEKIRLTRP